METPLGIIVKTDNVTLLRQKLYAARKSDPVFAPISLVPSPVNPDELWIVNKENARGPKD